MLYYFIDACALVCALICISHLRAWHKRSKSPRLPPGPKGFPVIGNLLDMKGPEMWETARKWGQTYGPLIHVEAFGTSYVYANPYQTAVDLLDKRGNIYSSRPKLAMIELTGWDWAISLFPYGDELRRSRQLLHRFFQPAVVQDYSELQTQVINRMLDRLLSRPDRFPELLRQAMGEITIFMAYGHQPQAENDPLIKIVEKGVQTAVEALEPSLVNLFPSLQYFPSWFPGTNFKKIVEGREVTSTLFNEPYEMAKRNMEEGVACSSIVSKLREASMSGDTIITSETLIKKVAGIIYTGGADTTISTLTTFLLAMLLHPEVQKRAQEELDQEVGKDVLPSLDDRPNLPYLEAVIKETFRWQPVLPFALAHTLDEDDEYNGYFIPKGASVLPNVWAMTRDPDEYPEPDRFLPERWLHVEGKQPPLDINKTFFGFGRRLCPGRHFANNTVFIGAASILAAFSVTKALDEDGIPVTPDVEYTLRFVRHPKPFRYELTLRSEKIGNVIRQAVETTK